MILCSPMRESPTRVRSPKIHEAHDHRQSGRIDELASWDMKRLAATIVDRMDELTCRDRLDACLKKEMKTQLSWAHSCGRFCTFKMRIEAIICMVVPRTVSEAG